MKFTERHHKAAKALANGASERVAAEELNICAMTISRWKRDEEFRALILQYSSPIRTAIANSNSNGAITDLYHLIPDREAPLIAKLETMLEKLGGILNDRLATLEAEIDDIPIRSLPPLLRAYCEGVQLLQQSHDRASGYELISRELIDIVSVKDNAQN